MNTGSPDLPSANSSPKSVIGIDRIERQEVLKDPDLSKVWKAAVSMGDPFGSLIQFLILTGQRLREAANMTWDEVDMAQKLWTIPASRMKSRQVQEVPLAPMALALLNELRSTTGFVFTTTGGKRPISGFSKYKARLDLLSGVSGWRIHDLRRTMRTNISSLPVEEKVRELVIAHGKKGLSRVYDQHEYRDEKARCFRLWEGKLQAVLSRKPPADITLWTTRVDRRTPKYEWKAKDKVGRPDHRGCEDLIRASTDRTIAESDGSASRKPGVLRNEL